MCKRLQTEAFCFSDFSELNVSLGFLCFPNTLHLSEVCCGMLYICLKTGRARRKIKLEHYLFGNATANKPSVENSCNIFGQYVFYEVLQKAADLESGTCLFIL